MYQYKLRYRDWDIAANFSNPLNEIWLDDFPNTVLIYEGAYIHDVIKFFEMLDAAIDKHEAERSN